jgi:hypothetical protein
MPKAPHLNRKSPESILETNLGEIKASGEVEEKGEPQREMRKM